jgi:hypothetical protein
MNKQIFDSFAAALKNVICGSAPWWLRIHNLESSRFAAC